MAGLSGTGNGLVSQVYKDLLWLNNSNQGAPASTLHTVYDGAGNATGLTLSQAGVGISNMSFSTSSLTTTSGNLDIESFSTTLTLGTATGSTVTIGNASGTTNINGTVTFGNTVNYTSLQIGDVSISSNTITAHTTNHSTTLSANGTGSVILGQSGGTAIQNAGDLPLYDSASQAVLSFPSAISSAVNNLKISNSATTNPLLITAVGSDNNIGITLTAKGTGVVTSTGAFTSSGAFTASSTSSLNGTVTMNGASINEAKGSDVSSSSTTNIGAATGNYINVTGTTTITAFDTVQAGTRRIVKFTGALTLTYNVTSLILPSAANITTAAGDTAEFVSLGSGNWICVQYTKANGKALISSSSTQPTIQAFTSGSSQTYTTPANCTRIVLELWGGGGGGGAASGGGGGGSGAYIKHQINSPSATYTYTVGSGGAGASSNPSAGNNGNDTTFSGGTLTAGGGKGSPGIAGGAGGTASGGNLINFQGVSGGSGGAFNGTQYSGGSGGGSGGGPGGTGTGAGGTSAAANTGGGGGGSANSATGGNGGSGYIVVNEFYN